LDLISKLYEELMAGVTEMPSKPFAPKFDRINIK